MRRKTRSSQPPLVCRAALGRALAQPTRGAWCCMGKWRFNPAAPVRTRCAWPSASRASWDAPPTRSVLSTGCHHPPSGSGAWCGRGVRRLATPVARARCHRRACAACCVRLWRAASAVRGPHTALGPRDGGDGLARARRGGEVCRGVKSAIKAVFRRRRVCVLRATPSDRGCDSEPGSPPGIKLRGQELDCSLGALTLTLALTRTPNLTLTLTLNQTDRT